MGPAGVGAREQPAVVGPEVVAGEAGEGRLVEAGVGVAI